MQAGSSKEERRRLPLVIPLAATSCRVASGNKQRKHRKPQLFHYAWKRAGSFRSAHNLIIIELLPLVMR